MNLAFAITEHILRILLGSNAGNVKGWGFWDFSCSTKYASDALLLINSISNVETILRIIWEKPTTPRKEILIESCVLFKKKWGDWLLF